MTEQSKTTQTLITIARFIIIALVVTVRIMFAIFGIVMALFLGGVKGASKAKMKSSADK